MEDFSFKVVEVSFGSFDLMEQYLFLVPDITTAEEVRKKYNKCINKLKQNKHLVTPTEKEGFIMEYLQEEYGWKQLAPNFVVTDPCGSYGKIEDEQYEKVSLEANE